MRQHWHTWRGAYLGLMFGAAMALALGNVKAQDHSHHNHPPALSQLHEQFYSKWQRPNHRNDAGERTHSCCNKEDCRPSPIKPRADGNFDVLNLKGEWVMMPRELLEENQRDPVESPDGLSHACVGASGTPFCAVRGSGQ